jgi:hypothetical protein
MLIFIRESFPDTDATFYGKPKYYAVFDDTTFILGPTPDIGYGAELHYFYYPESITTAAGGTSWMGDNYPTALLYGALLEAATYLKSDAETITNYSQRYNQTMEETLRSRRRQKILVMLIEAVKHEYLLEVEELHNGINSTRINQHI